MLLIVKFYHFTLYILRQFEFIFSLENNVMATSKCFVEILSLIFLFLNDYQNLSLMKQPRKSNSGTRKGQ